MLTTRDRAHHRTPASDTRLGFECDRPLVVFAAGSPWGSAIGTDRHMAERLTKYANLLWVDPPVSILTRRSMRFDARATFRPVLRAMGPALLRLTPAALPGHTRPVINATTDVLVRSQIRWAVAQLGQMPVAVVACMLDDVLRGWPRATTRVFYGTDDHVAGAELMNQRSRELARKERVQLANADVVIAVSRHLAVRFAYAGRPVALVPNGVDAEAYENVASLAPAEDVRLPRPIAGVVGQLSQRIDIALLEAVVSSGVSLLLVGPANPTWEPQRFARLIRQPRVQWVGRKAFAELPRYFRCMDVGLTPYARTPFNDASFPLKTLEYLAAGLPAVSTDLAAVAWLRCDLIRSASTPAAFAAAVGAALEEPASADLIQRRRAFAATHSWDRRVEDFARAIGLGAADGAGGTGLDNFAGRVVESIP